MSQDRPSWLKPDVESDRALAELLEAGRSEQPSAAQRAALAERLAPTFGDPGPSGGGGGGAAALGPARSWPALLAAAALMLALGGGAWWFARGPQSTPPLFELDESSQAAEPRPAAEASPGLEPPASAPLVEPPAPEPARTAVPADRAQLAPVARAVARSRAPRVKPAAAPLDAVAELRLLDAAERALASAPARALALTAQHAKQFANGQLVQERELLAIEALLRLDQPARAQARGRAFLTSYPGSSHAPRCRELLERASAAPP